METRRLGGNGLEVSALGLGCMGMSQAYGPTDDEQSVGVLHAALDAGITLLDTAMSYGAGANERLLARVLATRRDDVVLATKFGIVRDDHGVHVDARPERIRGYLEASLQRLRVERVDLYYLHRVDPHVPIEESIGAMAELVAVGKVGHLGVSETTPDDLERAAATHQISALQLEWSLAWREAEDDVIPAARRLGVGLVPYSPLGRGLLTGDVDVHELSGDDLRRRDPRFAGEEHRRNQGLVGVLGELAAELEATLGQLALAWLLAQGPDVVPIPGTKHTARLLENVAAAQLELSPQVVERIEAATPRSAWAGDRASFAAPATTRSSP